MVEPLDERGRSRARGSRHAGDPRVRRLRVPLLAPGLPVDRTGRAGARGPRPLRLPPLPADADPPACARGVRGGRGGGTARPLLGDARAALPPQKALEDDDLRTYASELGLDLARFDRDRAADEVLARIARDVASGEATGLVRGTPTLFIDGVLYQGGYDPAAFVEALPR